MAPQLFLRAKNHDFGGTPTQNITGANTQRIIQAILKKSVQICDILSIHKCM